MSCQFLLRSTWQFLLRNSCSCLNMCLLVSRSVRVSSPVIVPGHAHSQLSVLPRNASQTAAALETAVELTELAASYRLSLCRARTSSNLHLPWYVQDLTSSTLHSTTSLVSLSLQDCVLCTASAPLATSYQSLLLLHVIAASYLSLVDICYL